MSSRSCGALTIAAIQCALDVENSRIQAQANCFGKDPYARLIEARYGTLTVRPRQSTKGDVAPRGLAREGGSEAPPCDAIERLQATTPAEGEKVH
jgi:hypothetical protein